MRIIKSMLFLSLITFISSANAGDTYSCKYSVSHTTNTGFDKTFELTTNDEYLVFQAEHENIKAQYSFTMFSSLDDPSELVLQHIGSIVRDGNRSTSPQTIISLRFSEGQRKVSAYSSVCASEFDFSCWSISCELK